AWRRPRWSLEVPLWSLEVTVVSSRDAVTVEDLVTIDDPARYVNPFIGTKAGGLDFGHGGGAANTFPGASTPFGMVQFSPDTEVHQHGGGPGGGGRAEGVKPSPPARAGWAGPRPHAPAAPAGCAAARAAGPLPCSHQQEEASPGYYRVTLDSGVTVELSATTRTGIARIGYPAGPAGLVVDAGRAVNPATGEITVTGTGPSGYTELSGYTDSGGFCGTGNRYRLYFQLTTDTPVPADPARGPPPAP